MPSSSRQAYFALRAFNVEIASIKDASRSMGRSRADTDNDDFVTGDSSMASRLRMQWWKDGIAEIYDNIRNGDSVNTSSDPILRSLTSSRKQNPIMRSLSHAIHNHNLTHRFMRRVMDAREEDLEVVQYERCTDVAQYGEDTISSMLYLSLETVGVSCLLVVYDIVWVYDILRSVTNICRSEMRHQTWLHLISELVLV
jgi:NADH dehydrogenase [ubiquinone] 1 alpha subcomplex assembly factor 6